MRHLRTCLREATPVTTLKRGLAKRRHRRPRMPVRKLRASLEASGKRLGTSRSLEALLAPAEPVHPAVRVMNHPYSRIFSVTSPPNAVADESECAARISGSRVPDADAARVRKWLRHEHAIQDP